MKREMRKIGRKLQVECPNNDCRIYRDIYQMLEDVEGDLRTCNLSSHGKKTLQVEKRRLENEIETMYDTNFANVRSI